MKQDKSTFIVLIQSNRSKISFNLHANSKVEELGIFATMKQDKSMFIALIKRNDK